MAYRVKPQKSDPYYLYFTGACILAGVIFLAIIFRIDSTTAVVVDQVSHAPTPDLFSHISLTAKAALVYDVTDNTVLYAKNPDVALPLASLTKIMTALTANTLAPTSTVITIYKENLDQDGDNGLLLGERWTLENLLKFSLVVSSNDGADAVATGLGSHELGATLDGSRQQFVADMNNEALTLGLQHASFYNATGLDLDATHAGAYASARDTMLMFQYAAVHDLEIFEPTSHASISISSLNGFLHTGDNTDILTSKIPHLIISKTGYTDLAGGNLGVVFRPDPQHEFIIVVLGSTYDGRFADVDALATTSLAAVRQNN